MSGCAGGPNFRCPKLTTNIEDLPAGRKVRVKHTYATTHSTPGLVAHWVFSAHLYQRNKMADEGTFVACAKPSLRGNLLPVWSRKKHSNFRTDW